MESRKTVFRKIVEKYIIQGPPIGALLICFCYIIGAIFSILTKITDDNWVESILPLLGINLLIIICSPLVGLPQAIGCGIYIAKKVANNRPISRHHYYFTLIYIYTALALFSLPFPFPFNQDVETVAALFALFSTTSLFSCYVMLYLIQREYAETPYALQFTGR